MACNLQTQQITFDELFDEEIGFEGDDGDRDACAVENGKFYPVFNETTKELHIGRNKLRIMDDQVAKVTTCVESSLPNIVALNSNICTTFTSVGMK